jgi:hypothetical protein
VPVSLLKKLMTSTTPGWLGRCGKMGMRESSMGVPEFVCQNKSGFFLGKGRGMQ